MYALFIARHEATQGGAASSHSYSEFAQIALNELGQFEGATRLNSGTLVLDLCGGLRTLHSLQRLAEGRGLATEVLLLDQPPAFVSTPAPRTQP